MYVADTIATSIIECMNEVSVQKHDLLCQTITNNLNCNNVAITIRFIVKEFKII